MVIVFAKKAKQGSRPYRNIRKIAKNQYRCVMRIILLLGNKSWYNGIL